MASGDVVVGPDGTELVLGEIGTSIVFENEHVCVWEVRLDPGEVQGWHLHHHPYLIIGIESASNRMEFLDGDPPRDMEETAGRVVYREAGKIHKLINVGETRYVNRLVELKHLGENAAASANGRAAVVPTGRPAGISDEEWTGNLSAPALYAGAAPDASREQATVGPTGETLARFREVLLHLDDVEWVDKTLAGLSHKMLWRDEETGASIALVRFEQGAGIPSRHAHASNQFMFCVSGSYSYLPTGITLTPGTFYWNPKGSAHGPTRAEETSVLLEIYDGPHYPTQPDWYTDPKDAR